MGTRTAGIMRFGSCVGEVAFPPSQDPCAIVYKSVWSSTVHCDNTIFNQKLLVPVLFDLPGYHGNYRKRQFTILKQRDPSLTSSTYSTYIQQTTYNKHPQFFQFLKFSVVLVLLHYSPFFSCVSSHAFYAIFKQPGFSCILNHFSVAWVPLQFIPFIVAWVPLHFIPFVVAWVPLHFLPFFSSLGSSAVCTIFQQPGFSCIL